MSNELNNLQLVPILFKSPRDMGFYFFGCFNRIVESLSKKWGMELISINILIVVPDKSRAFYEQIIQSVINKMKSVVFEKTEFCKKASINCHFFSVDDFMEQVNFLDKADPNLNIAIDDISESVGTTVYDVLEYFPSIVESFGRENIIKGIDELFRDKDLDELKKEIDLQIAKDYFGKSENP